MEDDLIQHHVYCWVVKNVYLCEKLLTSYIEGPPFKRNMPSNCEWTLQLGQYEKSEGDGIRLFIQSTGTFKDVLVNFHVSIREQKSAKPFLYRKFQNKFREGLVWSSPVIISNEKFRQKYLTSEKISRFWDIRVELMYKEDVDLESTVSFLPMTADLRYKKDVGADLKKYLGGPFSDIFVKIVAEEIKAHKAILHARCIYFADKLSSYEKSLIKEDDLSPTDDPEVMKSVMIYLYSGDIHSLPNPLPLGIFKCAKRMKLYDLEWLTLPTEATGISDVISQNVDLEFDFLDFETEIHKENPSINIESSRFGDYGNTFALVIKITPEFPEHLSVFVKSISGKRIFAHVELSIRSKAKTAIVMKRVVGNLEKGECLGFEKFRRVEEFLRNNEYFDEGTTRFMCKITYTKGDIDTHEESNSGKCSLDIEKSKKLSSEDVYCATHHGYRLMADDLERLLKTSAFSDCIVIVCGKSFHLHKVILAARSPYFLEKLGGTQIDTQDSMDTSVNEIIIDKNIPAEHMDIILQEIYTGSAKIQDEETASALYPLSKFFGLPNLEMKCSKHMKEIPKEALSELGSKTLKQLYPNDKNGFSEPNESEIEITAEQKDPDL